LACNEAKFKMYRSCYLIIHVKRITQKYVDFSFMCSFLVLLSLEIHTIYCVVIVLATFMTCAVLKCVPLHPLQLLFGLSHHYFPTVIIRKPLSSSNWFLYQHLYSETCLESQ